MAHKKICQIKLLDSEARTSSPDAIFLSTFRDQFVGVEKNQAHLILNITAVTSTPAITLTLFSKDPASGVYYPVFQSGEYSEVTDPYPNVHKIGIGFEPIAGMTANDFFPEDGKIEITHDNANSITYSLGLILM